MGIMARRRQKQAAKKKAQVAEVEQPKKPAPKKAEKPVKKSEE